MNKTGLMDLVKLKYLLNDSSVEVMVGAVAEPEGSSETHSVSCSFALRASELLSLLEMAPRGKGSLHSDFWSCMGLTAPSPSGSITEWDMQIPNGG